MDGDALIFVGAGLSFLSRDKNGDKLPNGANLVDLLLDQPPGTGSKHPLDRVAGHIVRSKSVDFLYDLLLEKFTVMHIDPRLEKLYSLPWRRIYTTNYDNAIETALKGKRPVSRLTLDDTTTSAAPGSIIHLNGFIGDVTPANIQSGLVLTDYSYASSRLRDSEWFRFFLRDLRSARAIFFVGYSLADLDIQRLLITDPTLSLKTFFFIAPDADELEIGAISEYGALVPGGIDALIGGIDEASADYSGVRFSAGFLCLTEFDTNTAFRVGTTNAQKLSDQLVYGKLPEYEALHHEKIFGNQEYIITRKQNRDAIEALRIGPWRDILVIGELASGKTASALNLSVHLIDQGYRIFYASRGKTLSDELRKLSTSTDKIAVVFENYTGFMPEIRSYVATRNQTHRVILTERTAVHDFSPDFLDTIAHLGPLFETRLNKIEPVDVPAFESLVNFGGFWGDRAGASEATRQRIITGQLESSLYKLLIEIIKSERVQAEVRSLLAPLMNDEKMMKLFTCSFIVNALGFKFSINDWQAIFDGQWVRRIVKSYSDQVRHFLSLQGDTIFPRAGVLSTQILSTIADDGMVKDSLVELYERASDGEDTDPELASLRIALTRYGAIEPIFSGKKKANNIFAYYEEIRVYGNTRNNPDYWLQVGIAATVHEDLDRAKTAFENAYSREKARKKPNLKKIDNYFSRYEMQKAVEENDSDVAFSMFAKASERLKKQMFLEENRHYPFKTGRYYTDIAAKHYRSWSESQQSQFLREAKDIRERAMEWNRKGHQLNIDVEILIRETTNLVQRIEARQR